MSEIYTHWKCEYCCFSFEQYISFGHPEKGFDFKWICPVCKKENTFHVSGENEKYTDIVRYIFNRRKDGLQEKIGEISKEKLKEISENIMSEMRKERFYGNRFKPVHQA